MLPGPPPDPRQVLLAPTPTAWAVSLVLVAILAAAAWSFHRRAFPHTARFTGMLAAVTLLTAPGAGMLPSAWWGSFPTIDKAGSLLYFQRGVQWRLFDVDDPGLQLIGAHVGHLWPTSLLALALPDHAAFGAQHLLQLAVAWFAASLLLEEVCGDRRVAVLCAAPFALNLHQLRDINWYTVEKTMIFWVPLHAWTLLRTHRSPGTRSALTCGLVFLGACLTNLYVAWLCAGVAVCLTLATRSRGAMSALAATILAGLPVAILQLALLKRPGAVGTPEAFLLQRAALDVVELWPARWNRLEAMAALDPSTVVLAAVGSLAIFVGRGDSPRNAPLPVAGVARVALTIGFVFLALSLGPLPANDGPVTHPVYSALGLIPGAWRIAKPETFFHVTWLAGCTLAALGLLRVGASSRRLALVAVTMLAAWVFVVRAHPVAPPYAAPDATSPAPRR